MAGKVLEVEHIISPDQLAVQISDYWHTWNSLRQERMAEVRETRAYIYATDTTKTTNAKLPWKNKTVTPKLCQIRDNIYANYMKSFFPKRKWMVWEGEDPKSAEAETKKTIESYMAWAVDRSDLKNTVSLLVLDWIDTGNCFGTVDWVDERISTATGDKVGYVGPKAIRISPLDIVFNPIAPDFKSTPKIIRSFISMGELKEMIERETTPENFEAMKDLFNYLKDLRTQVAQFSGEVTTKDEYLRVDGFNSFQAYLQGDYVEVLTFYGDLYDNDNDIFYKNYVITVVDKHKIISKKQNPTLFGYPQIFHVGWRPRQDNLWAMGPLDNLVGMQYRIDHLENLKADVFDLIAFPVLKVKGYVDDFVWQPMEKIQVSEDGDVEMVVPDAQILNANLEINALEQKMEEMAGAPKEAMGFRTPGEKTKYEVQRLENASNRIFQSKTEMFEEQMTERLLSAMLELARRRMATTTIRITDPEFNIAEFLQISSTDISGNGKLRPIASRHFAEQADKVQNATAFFNSAVGQDPAVTMHISGLEIARMFESLLDLEGYTLVTPNIRITEQAEAMKLQNAEQESVMTEAGTPSGLTPDDFST